MRLDLFSSRCALIAVSLLAVAGLDLAPSHARAVSARQLVAIQPAKPAAPQQHSSLGRSALPHVAARIVQGHLRIVAFGSSSTQGIGASSTATSYPSRLQADLATLMPHVSVAVINQGIGGDDALDLDRRLPNVLALRPDLVIFQTGTNDPLRGLPLDQFLTLTRDGVSQMHAAGIDVMLMEPQLCRVTANTPTSIVYRDAVRRIAAEMQVPVIKRWDLMKSWLTRDLVTPVQMLAPDGLHMADAGYSLLAAEVAQEIVTGSTP